MQSYIDGMQETSYRNLIKLEEWKVDVLHMSLSFILHQSQTRVSESCIWCTHSIYQVLEIGKHYFSHNDERKWRKYNLLMIETSIQHVSISNWSCKSFIGRHVLPMVLLAPLALPLVPLAPLAAETVHGSLVANGTNGNQWHQWQNYQWYHWKNHERSHRCWVFHFQVTGD